MFLGIPAKKNDKALEFLTNILELTLAGLTKAMKSLMSFLVMGVLCHQGANPNPGLLWGTEAIEVPAPREVPLGGQSGVGCWSVVLVAALGQKQQERHPGKACVLA